MILTDSMAAANSVKKWSTQSREDAPWYQHEEIGYNYRMSNVVAGVVRGQFPYLADHIARKKALYERYRDGFQGLPVTMNPFIAEDMEPNFWLSCLLIDQAAMCKQVREDQKAFYVSQPGKTCPSEIYEHLTNHRAQCRPIWKPMHLQPIYRNHAFVTAADGSADVAADLFDRGLCLPSDIKMTHEEQDRIIQIVRRCFS